jgi:UBX domain-containing protein 1
MDHKQLKATFQEITSCGPEESEFYLQASNWNLELAVNAFSGNRDSSPASSNSVPFKPSVQPAKRSAGVRGFSDFQSNEEDDEDSVNWFTGGQKSGIQVQAPKKSGEVIDDVMKVAQQSGGVSASEDAKPKPFAGGGHRLGNTTAPGAPVPSQGSKEVRLKIVFWRTDSPWGTAPSAISTTQGSRPSSTP